MFISICAILIDVEILTACSFLRSKYLTFPLFVCIITNVCAIFFLYYENSYVILKPNKNQFSYEMYAFRTLHIQKTGPIYLFSFLFFFSFIPIVLYVCSCGIVFETIFIVDFGSNGAIYRTHFGSANDSINNSRGQVNFPVFGELCTARFMS